jgi:hypothetical protein
MRAMSRFVSTFFRICRPPNVRHGWRRGTHECALHGSGEGGEVAELFRFGVSPWELFVRASFLY